MSGLFSLILSKSIFPIAVIILGMILGRHIQRLDDRSIAAVCLFAFVPVWLFRHAQIQTPFSHTFIFILFFILFHTVALYLIAYIVFQFLDISPRVHRLFLMNTMVISFYGLRQMQSLLGDPAQAVQMVNMIIFYYMVVMATLGVYLVGEENRNFGEIGTVLTTPLIYALGAGLIFAIGKIDLPYAVLESVDSMHNVTIPLSLLLVGILYGRHVFLAEIKEYGVLVPGLILVIFFRMILSPLLALLIVPLVVMENVALQRALILASGAPIGLLAGVLVGYYGKQNEKRFVVLSIFITSLLHFITLPLLLAIVDRWFPLQP